MNKVYVLTYDHKHGTDISIYSTEELAEKGAGQTMKEWIDELDQEETNSKRQKILSLLEEGAFVKAMNLWTEYSGGNECFEIFEREVISV